jgi:hypothetical protein
MTNRIPICAYLLAFAGLGVSAAEPPPPSPAAQAAERAAALAAAGLAFAGDWHATEVIVFERSLVDAARYGEGLFVDRPRHYPIELRSLDAPVTGSIHYSADPDAPQCLHLQPGDPTAPMAKANAIPEAFARPAAPAVPDTPAVASAPTAAESVPIPPEPPPDPLEPLRQAVRDYEASLSEQSFAWLAPESRVMNQHAARLAGNGYRVLFHAAWVQNLAARKAPDAILIQAGRRDGNMAELEGFLRFGGGRGPRFDADLWYRPPGNAAPDQYVELREARRLADGEIHYLDHPKLGVLVRTERVQVPADVVQAFEALNLPATESVEATAPSAPPRPQ